MSSVKTIPLAGAPPSTRFRLKIAFSTTPARESIVAVTKSTASRARSKLLTLNSDISQLPSLRNRAMAGWSAGYRAARVRRQLTPGPISSLRGTAGSPPFISFSTNYPDLDSALRRPMLRIGKRREEYSRSLKLLCLKRSIEAGRCNQLAFKTKRHGLHLAWELDRAIRQTPNGGRGRGEWVDFRGDVALRQPYRHCRFCGANTGDHCCPGKLLQLEHKHCRFSVMHAFWR